MEVSGKMEIQILHRDYLSVPAAGSAALDPEARPERRLSQGKHCVFAELCHCLAQPDRGRCLSLPGRRRVDRSHKDKLPVLPVFDAVPEFVGKLCLIFSVKLQFILHDTRARRHVPDMFHFCFLSDLNICLHFFPPLHLSSARHFIL